TYNWMHDGHNPYSEQDIKESRLPSDVKNWIEKHVEEKKDWRGMKDLLQLSNEEMNEFENEINVDANVLKIPAALRVHCHDNVNQIQQRLNNFSRRHRFDKVPKGGLIPLKKKVMIRYLKLLIHLKLTKRLMVPRKNY
ncbi:hypothetical protein BDC45DRAFT_519059, partial [Circinella umbellata]